MIRDYLNFLLTISFIAVFSATALSQKNDTLVFKDGTRQIGEIKSLQYGKLRFITRYMGGANITWTNIYRIMSPKDLTVKMSNGNIHTGHLVDSGREYLMLLISKKDSISVELPMSNVAAMAPVKKRKLYRIYGYVDAGFSYTKGANVRQWNLGSQIGYKTDYYDFRMNFNSINTFQGSINQKTIKEDLRFSANKDLSHRMLLSGYFAFERNTELEIDLRTITGIGIGNEVLRRPRHTMALRLFPLYNIERYTTTDGVVATDRNQETVEAGVFFDWKAFKYSFPELFFDTEVSYYHNFTLGNRNRVNVETSLQYELIDDLFITLTFYDNFDSNPPSETAARNDWGTTTKLRFMFKGGQRIKRKKKNR